MPLLWQAPRRTMHSRRLLCYGRGNQWPLHRRQGHHTAVAKAADPTTSREETFGDSQQYWLGDIITNAVL